MTVLASRGLVNKGVSAAACVAQGLRNVITGDIYSHTGERHDAEEKRVEGSGDAWSGTASCGAQLCRCPER